MKIFFRLMLEEPYSSSFLVWFPTSWPGRVEVELQGGRESRVPQIVITATQICFAASALLK